MLISLFTGHIARPDPNPTRHDYCGCWDHIRTATAVTPLPCDHIVLRNAMLFRYPYSAIKQVQSFITLSTKTISFNNKQSIAMRTTRLTLGTEGPWFKISSTISASPVQAAR